MRAALRGDAAVSIGCFREALARAATAAWLADRPRRGGGDDIAREGFLAALRALDRFDSARPFGPWLRTIVARRAIDAARGTAYAARSARSRWAHALRGRAPRAWTDDVLAAIAALPDEQRIPIALRHLLGFTPVRSPAARSPARHGQLPPSPRPRYPLGGARVPT